MLAPSLTVCEMYMLSSGAGVHSVTPSALALQILLGGEVHADNVIIRATQCERFAPVHLWCLTAKPGPLWATNPLEMPRTASTSAHCTSGLGQGHYATSLEQLVEGDGSFLRS